MRWFGKSWGAPVNESCEECPVPAGRACGYCDKPLREDSQGLLLPFLGSPADPKDLPYHLKCFLESVGVKGGPQRPVLRTNGFKGHSVRPPSQGVSSEGPESGEPAFKDGPGKK